MKLRKKKMSCNNIFQLDELSVERSSMEEVLQKQGSVQEVLKKHKAFQQTCHVLPESVFGYFLH